MMLRKDEIPVHFLYRDDYNNVRTTCAEEKEGDAGSPHFVQVTCIKCYYQQQVWWCRN